MNILAYVEIKDQKALGASLELLSAAASLGGKADAVLIGKIPEEAANETSMAGAAKVMIVDAPEEPVSEEYISNALAEISKGYDLVLLAATSEGKVLTPRLAARLHGGSVNDAISLSLTDEKVTAVRPVYAGTLQENVRILASPAVISIRSRSYEKLVNQEKGTIVRVDSLQECAILHTKVTETIHEVEETANIEDAAVVVAGGRGMGDEEGFDLCQQLADILGGAVGATRPAVENNWIGRTHQIGQSGKIVKPDLYIACGISGSAQHVSGMIDSKFIVAINKDEDAPIFQIADVAIVGDVKKILPIFIEKIKKRKEA